MFVVQARALLSTSKITLLLETMNKPLPSNQIIVNASQFSEPESIPSIFSTVGQQLQAVQKSSLVDRFFRTKFIELFQKLEGGCIHVVDALGTTPVGKIDAKLQCTLMIHDLSSYTQIALSGSNGSAQAYINGLWSADDLSKLIRIFVKNRTVLGIRFGQTRAIIISSME